MAYETLEIPYGPKINLAAWQEAPQPPHIDGQPTLDAREDPALNGGSLIVCLGQVIPYPNSVGLLLGEHDHPVYVFGPLQEDIDLFAHLEVAATVGELVEPNEPFGLIAYIHQDGITLNLHDVAG